MLHPLVANVTCAPKLDVRQYCITFFYDGLFILAGIAPPKELWLGMQYATYAQQINYKMELFVMKTWWRLLFNAGYRIENWPCSGQIPAKLNEPAFKTPVQHWPVVMRHAIVKQYCNPNMDQRLRIVCREHDQEWIPFITIALGADDERLAQPADYPGDIVNTRPHNCKCFKHNGIDVAPRYLAKADTPVSRVTPATGTIPVPKTKSCKAPVVVGAKGKKRASPAQLQSETVSTSRQGSAPPTATIARSTRAGMKRKHTTGDNGLTAITEEEDAGLVGKTAENIDDGDTSLTNNQEKPPSKKARVVEQVAETSFGGRFKVAPRAIPKGGKSNASQSTVTPPSVPQPVLAAPQQPRSPPPLQSHMQHPKALSPIEEQQQQQHIPMRVSMLPERPPDALVQPALHASSVPGVPAVNRPIPAVAQVRTIRDWGNMGEILVWTTSFASKIIAKVAAEQRQGNTVNIAQYVQPAADKGATYFKAYWDRVKAERGQPPLFEDFMELARQMPALLIQRRDICNVNGVSLWAQIIVTIVRQDFSLCPCDVQAVEEFVVLLKATVWTTLFTKKIVKVVSDGQKQDIMVNISQYTEVAIQMGCKFFEDYWNIPENANDHPTFDGFLFLAQQISAILEHHPDYCNANGATLWARIVVAIVGKHPVVLPSDEDAITYFVEALSAVGITTENLKGIRVALRTQLRAKKKEVYGEILHDPGVVMDSDDAFFQ
ncbi:hypothetical protein M422DRAFT_259353 [Sphaerobolus stellatus SS14]|uniref:Uncharacterized protein n=1 Tax=Sphaerobolus stellatus (strain SS14) TaxID=990650 RepID=A0A0C9VJW9_SPHS4|nr:hypothetical protein M422DRAFT_259353 [Sphaerobolus stellatus SS14]